MRNINHHKEKKFICRRCFSHFYSQERLDKHLPDCMLQGVNVKQLPQCEKCSEFSENCEGCQLAATFEFRQQRTLQRIPVYMVADFESFLVPMNEPSGGRTRKIQEHIPVAYGIKVVVAPEYQHLDCFQEFQEMPIIIETANTLNNDLSRNFLQKVHDLGHHIKETIVNQDQPLIWREGEYQQYLEATHCHICEAPIKDQDQKVADHCHLTSWFRGAAHNDCNINFNLQHLKIPVVLHNLKGYDSKFILRQIGQMKSGLGKNISVLAQNSEKFKFITVGSVRFIDSLAHLPSSLEGLVENLKKNCQNVREVFSNMSEEFPDSNHLELLLRKGIFPYQFLSCPEALESPQLPSKDVFEDRVTEEDYHHAQNVWTTFKMKTFQEYMELYLKTDVLLLADVVNNYKKVTYNHYGLDPLWFLTTPSVGLAAALKLTKVKLDLITDIDMYNFVAKSVRGGLSYICHRKAEANNHHLNPNMSQYEKPSYIGYFDANNLYGWSMLKPLPVGGYQWIDSLLWEDSLGDKIKNGANFLTVLQELDQQSTNYYLEVDAEFPKKIHDKMCDYPMLPEHMVPPPDSTKVEKLINHLMPRKKYVIAYETYLLALQHGVVFSRIHRVLQFQQSAWLKPYIEFNTHQRQLATNEFEKSYFKLMNNSVFGKLLEDVTKYINFELFLPEKRKKYQRMHEQKPYMIQRESVYHRCQNHTQEPNMEKCTGGDGCVVGMQKLKNKITLNKPIMVGSKVLELSKVLMYDFFYNTVQPFFKDMIKLLATDTDSFIVQVMTNDLYSDLEQLKKDFDFSNYPTEHQLYDETNARVPGKFKDEYPNHQIEKFIGLRSKCYAIRTVKGEEKRAKGVRKDVIKKDINLGDYEKVLLDKIPITRQQQMIRSFHQQLYTVQQNKIALSALDEKRYILPDGITTLPWGHKDIPTEMEIE